MSVNHPADLVFLGLNGAVTALQKSDGKIAWMTKITGGGLLTRAGGFVTLTCDSSRVYCYTIGHIHCLDIRNGRLLWTNELAGYGFGVASLCVQGEANGADSVAYQVMQEDERRRNSQD